MSASDLSAPRSSAPLIGLTTYLEQAQTGVWDVPAAFLPKVYFEAVSRAGGIPVLLPPQPVDASIAATVLDALDGLIVTGGKDVDPARYGQAPHPATDEPRPERDAWEDALLTAAIERELPFLGICRGLQVLNVARGGSLIQHLPDLVGSTRYNAGGGVFTVNEVGIDAGTKLAELVQDAAIGVKSYHHQAVDELGDGLVVTARSDDGTVQAVELPGHPFGVAVQWHPEEDAAEDARLFAGLVEAARSYRAAKEQ
ncbi:MAG: gamma-glutamyl-gamma-aminobutyrate hydrolase [Leifsonia xyli]|nr:MAG: gamma-glutamyl-gamma-aminobutyrate hydrolase [Leifsonia xyli]